MSVTKTNIPQLCIVQSELYERARILGTYLEVRSGFFQHHNLPVLPYPHNHGVYLPDIEYESIKKISIDPSYHPESYSKTQLSLLADTQLKRQGKLTYPILRQPIEKCIQSLCADLAILFPRLIHKIGHIIIIPTSYGTTSSFDFKKKRDRYYVYLWVRVDSIKTGVFIDRLVHAYISILVLVETKISDLQSIEWQHKEFLIDFILHHTCIASLLSQPTRTLKPISAPQFSQKIYEDSKKFLRKLGLEKPSGVAKRGQIYYFLNLPVSSFSHREREIVDYLFLHTDRYVPTDELLTHIGAEHLGNWAVSKCIQRIRQKLKRNGSSASPLLTSRNQGYRLLAKSGR